MVREAGWKYVHFERFPPQLFDLDADPAEQHDLGVSPDYEAVRERLRGRLFSWLISRRTRVTMSDSLIEQITGGAKKRGYRFGEW